MKARNAVYRHTRAMWPQDTDPAGLSRIDANDAAGNVEVSFLRFAPDGSALAYPSNFTGMPHESYWLGLPWTCHWGEVLNTDAVAHHSSGVGKLGGVRRWGRACTGSRPRPCSSCRRWAPCGMPATARGLSAPGQDGGERRSNKR